MNTLKKRFQEVIQKLSTFVFAIFFIRNVLKKTVSLSTENSIYTNRGQVNESKIKYTSGIWGSVTLFLVYLKYFKAFDIPESLLLGGGVLWFLIPVYQNIRYCNKFVLELIVKIVEGGHPIKLVEALPRLLRDLKGVGLLPKEGFRSIYLKETSKATVRIYFEMNGKMITEEVKSWNQPMLQVCFVYPQKVDVLSKTKFVSQSKFKIEFSHYAEKNWLDFSEKILQNPKFNLDFPEVRKKIKEDTHKKEQQLQKNKTEKIMNEYKDLVNEKGINNRVIKILNIFIENEEEWNLTLWKTSDYLEGNQRYARFSLKLKNQTEFQVAKKLESTLQRSLNANVTLSEVVTDKSIAKILIVFEPFLEKYNKPFGEIQKLNLADKVFIGESITGPVVANYNSKANHTFIIGESGSGKSFHITNYLTQLINLQSFAHTEIYIISAAKTSDFAVFGEKGASLTEGIENAIHSISEVLTTIVKRETLFKDNKVKNIQEYNDSVPKSDQLSRIAVVIDEWETLLQMNSEIETAVVSLLNLGRSSGITVIIGSQSALKKSTGSVRDKVQVSFIGKIPRDVATSINEKGIGEYFSRLAFSPEGVFFYKGSNLGLLRNRVLHENSEYQLIQTPYSKDFDKYIPALQGKNTVDKTSGADLIRNKLDEIDI